MLLLKYHHTLYFNKNYAVFVGLSRNDTMTGIGICNYYWQDRGGLQCRLRVEIKG